METMEIEGTTYVTATAVAEEVDVCRQTLWRWRQEGKIPLGHRLRRNGQVLFTRERNNRIPMSRNDIYEKEISRETS